MSHQPGAYLGGVRSVADVRLRCVLDADSGCWHLRTGHGKPQPLGRVQRIWVHGRGSVSATRAVWELAHEAPLPRGRRAVRVCGSYDCANPEHIRALSHADAQRRIVGKWHEMTPRRRANLERIQRSRRKFTSQQVLEVRLGTESVAALARKWGVSRTALQAIRDGKTYRDPVSSVWRLAA